MDLGTPQWLVRTAQNLVAGPYSREQVRQMILSGQLKAQDEICRSNHYWIQLHEREEVSAELGSDVLAHLSNDVDEEATLTRTDPGAGLRPVQTTSASKTPFPEAPPAESPSEEVIPDLPDLAEFEDEQTSVLTHQQMGKLSQPHARPPTPTPTPAPASAPRPVPPALTLSLEPQNTQAQRVYPDTRGERVRAVEPSAFWRWLVGALVFGCALLLFHLLKRLQ
jgi:hypothetical protein